MCIRRGDWRLERIYEPIFCDGLRPSGNEKQNSTYSKISRKLRGKELTFDSWTWTKRVHWSYWPGRPLQPRWTRALQLSFFQKRKSFCHKRKILIWVGNHACSHSSISHQTHLRKKRAHFYDGVGRDWRHIPSYRKHSLLPHLLLHPKPVHERRHRPHANQKESQELVSSKSLQWNSWQWDRKNTDSRRCKEFGSGGEKNP